MSKKRKTRRYNTKQIAKTPLLKKSIAVLLAQHVPRTLPVEEMLVNMLAYGHRGFISHSEDDLCKMFDKMYTLKLEELEQALSELNDVDKVRAQRWVINSDQRKVDRLRETVRHFENIANEIFEDKVLS